MADEGTIMLRNKKLFQGGFAGTDPDVLRRMRLHFGLVFQHFNLFPQYTALENVTLAPTLLDENADKSKIIENGKRLLNQMGLSDRMGNYPHQLSGGQQQRVAIARALALQPDILCFDEPTSALDPETIQEVLDVMIKLAKENITMVVVTHEMGFARQVADRVIFMEDGQIIESGTPEHFFNNPESERVKQFLGKIIR